MTPKNYISTDPGSEQDFVDKQLGPVHHGLIIDWKKLEGEKFGATKTAS